MIRLFAHRGMVSKNILENSIASLKAAHEKKFDGVEFDIWFVDKKLVVKHDQPRVKEVSQLPSLVQYFTFKNDLIYWMDFKNLDEKNVAEALVALKKIIAETGVKLDQIYFAPFITDYKLAAKIFAEARKILGEEINLVAVCVKLENFEAEKKLHEFLRENNIKFLSIFYQLLSKNFIKTFAGIEIFAWTVNDLNKLLSLESLGVRNIATDKITPQNYDRKT